MKVESNSWRRARVGVGEEEQCLLQTAINLQSFMPTTEQCQSLGIRLWHSATTGLLAPSFLQRLEGACEERTLWEDCSKSPLPFAPSSPDGCMFSAVFLNLLLEGTCFSSS